MKQPELRPLHYTETAYDSRRDGLPPDAADIVVRGGSLLAFQVRKYPARAKGVECAEYAGNNDLASYLEISREKLVSMAVEHGLPYRITWMPLTNPRIAVMTIKDLAIAVTWINIIAAIILGILGGVSIDMLLDSALFVGVPYAIYRLAKLLVDKGWIPNLNNIYFERETGMVEARWAGKRRRVPFRECAAAIVPMGGGAHFRFHLVVYHTKSGLIVKDPADYLSAWEVDQRWEYLQQYMDISKPLPDVPWLEPFRHLDPTTAAHDRATGRPEVVWGEMTPETATEIHDWSREAAKQYPWGLKREEALALGWRPSGYGDRDRFWEHLPEKKAAPDESSREQTQARAGGTE